MAGLLQPCPGVDARHLFTDTLGLIAPSGHALMRAARLDWAGLQGETFAGLAGDNVTASLMRRARDAPAGLFEPRFEVHSNEALAQLLRGGLAVCVLSAMSSRHAAFRGLRFRIVEGPALHRSMCLQTRSGRSLSPAAKALLDEVELGLASLPRQRRGRHADCVVSPIEVAGVRRGT